MHHVGLDDVTAALDHLYGAHTAIRDGTFLIQLEHRGEHALRQCIVELLALEILLYQGRGLARGLARGETCKVLTDGTREVRGETLRETQHRDRKSVV